MKKRAGEVMMGCWAIGGPAAALQNSPDALLVTHGPFSGTMFPSSKDVQALPRSWSLPPLARFAHDGIDFMPFILYETVTVDRLAFDCMVGARPSLPGWQASPQSVGIIESLAADGHLITEDYRARLDSPQISRLLDAAISSDLSDPNIVVPCHESLALWIQFYKDLLGLSDHQLSKFHRMISGLEGDAAHGNDAFGYLYECVADINRILVISQVLNKPIYEWEDYYRFYRYKFLRVAQDKPGRTLGHTLAELFEVFLPNFQVTSYPQLLDIMHDRRLASVRKLAEGLGDEPIPKDLVLQAYQDVRHIEENIKTFSRYTGLVGLALNLIPAPALGDAFQWAADSLFRGRQERRVKWQMFFVERATPYTRQNIEDRLRQIDK